jgi:hypothetical protein
MTFTPFDVTKSPPSEDSATWVLHLRTKYEQGKAEAEAKAEAEEYAGAVNDFHIARENFITMGIGGARQWYKTALATYRSHWDITEWVWYTLVGVPSTGKWFTWKYAWRRIIVWAALIVVVYFNKQITAAII